MDDRQDKLKNAPEAPPEQASPEQASPEQASPEQAPPQRIVDFDEPAKPTDEAEDEARRRRLATAGDLKRKRGGGGHRRLWSLLAAVVVLGLAVGGYFLADRMKPEPEALPTPGPTAIPIVDMTSKDVVSVKVSQADAEPYTLIQPEEGSLQIEDDELFTLNDTYARAVISGMASVKMPAMVEENAADLAPYGLDNPAVTAEATYSDGSVHTIALGGQVPTGYSYYAMVDGKPDVYTSSSSLYQALTRPYNQLHAIPTIFSGDPTQTLFDELRVERPGMDTIEMKWFTVTNSMSINSLQLTQPVQYSANSERSSEMFTSMASLSLTGYAGRADDPALYGLDVPRMHLFAQVQVADAAEGEEASLPPVIDVYVGSVVPEDSTLSYCRVDDSLDVYTIANDQLAFVNNATVPYLIEQFTNLVNIAKVDKVTVLGGGEQYELTIQRQPDLDENGEQKTGNNGEPQTIDTYYVDGEVGDESLFKKLYQEIIGVLVDGVTDDYDIQGKAVVTVKYELLDDLPPFQVDYIEYNQDYYAVRRDGQTLFYIRHEKIERMLQAIELFKQGKFTGKASDFYQD